MSSKKYFNSDSEDDESDGDEESILFPRKKKVEKSIEVDSEEEDKLLADSDSDYDDDDNDDDAPENIGFSQSRQTALDHVKKTLAQIKGVRREQKEKRKQKNETFKQQKLEALNKNRLPDDFLDELADEPSPPKKSKTFQQSENNVRQQMQASAEDSGNNSAENVICSDEEFIPLDKFNSGIEAVALADYLKQQPKSASEKAEEFRHNLLYGSKVPRMSSKEIHNTLAKRAARYK